VRLLDGRAIAADLADRLRTRAAELRQAGVVPTLAVVAAGGDGATASYVRMLERGGARVGIECRTRWLPPAVDAAAIGEQLDELSADPSVHGIVLQTPLPAGIEPAELAPRICPTKDVDGIGPASAARLLLGRPGFVPATALAIMEILGRAAAPLAGARAVVVGRSLVVGRPAALLLLLADATVTICHSRTRDLASVTREADVLVVAVGRPGLIGAGFVRRGAVVIDAGTNVTEAGLVGDVDLEAVGPLVEAITPVPGGVGPVTTMMLLQQTLSAASSA
jgi:methylenetetrahydrofolate dehydrogenase (NADP+) / methenyltetrahydrofolate cyclohydrolase